MIHSQKSYTDKIMESLEPIGLSEKEREQVEAYLSGERGRKSWMTWKNGIFIRSLLSV